ncbi:MAG: sensor histidine kinase [Marinifilaceae bacterium]
MLEYSFPPIFVKRKYLTHLLFWLLFTALYTFVYGSIGGQYLIKFIHTLLLLPVMLSASYFTVYVLVPKLLVRKRILLFLLGFLLSALVFSVLQRTSYKYFIIPICYLDAMVTEFYMPGQILREFIRVYAVVSLFATLKFMKQWLESNRDNQILTQKNLESELALLKGQIHPHFLFNTLNNLYALALRKSDQTAEGILKLSSLLDYMLYQCNEPYVSLEKEIELIKNYISLESLRYGHRLEVDLGISGTQNSKQIAPMLILPFIENSFKHGVSKKSKNNRIVVRIKTEEKNFSLLVENSKSDTPVKDHHGYTNGIGLKNVKRRLELLYPNQHTLIVREEKSVFRVDLKLKISNT